MTELESTFTAPPDGVWTDEVGTITGELELHTVCTDKGLLIARVRYADALEWYTVRGGQAQLLDMRDHHAVHQLLVNVLHYPGS